MVFNPRNKRDLTSRKKWRKARKPLTEEQKAERRERLTKARASKKPPEHVTVDSTVRDLPDEHPVSLKKVREWIKSNKDERDGLRKILGTSNDKIVRNKFNILECYVLDMQSYIRTGIWLASRFGEHMQHKVKHRCLTMAYDKDGVPKRNVDTWYPDMGWYTQEMYEADHPEIAPKRKKKRVLTGSAS